jgi:ribosome-associated protein
VAERSRRGVPRPVRAAAAALADRKGTDILVLDLRGVNDATDFFVLCSGTSDAHVRGLSDAVLERLDRAGLPAHHVEGMPGGRWVLLDFVDFVVHVFHPDTRAFYQLERLWSDAPAVLRDPGGGTPKGR